VKIRDDLGREIIIDKVPENIVSLVPSITETVAALGFEKQLKGITRFCKYPENIKQTATPIGGIKNIDITKIKALLPDLILAEKDENNKEQVLELSLYFPIYVFDIRNYNHGLQMIKTLGKLFWQNALANSTVNNIEAAFAKIKKPVKFHKTLYLIWKKPWMAAGRKTFIGSIMAKAGFDNCIQGTYPEINEKEFQKADMILLSSEPYSFSTKEHNELIKKYPKKKILLVDGEMFAWPGIRMLKAAKYFNDKLFF